MSSQTASGVNKINKLFLIGLMIGLFWTASVNISLAADCPKGTTPTNEAICNPAKEFFVDLDGKPGGNSFEGILLFIVQAVLGIVGILSIAFIIIGGFQYITSGGNEEQAETGKKTLTNAIIGLVIVVMSYIIVAVVVNALFGNVGR